MAPRSFSLVDAIAYGWRAFKRNLGPALLVGAGSLATTLIANELAEGAERRGGFALVLVLGLAAQVVQIFWSYVWIRLGLVVHDAHEPRPSAVLCDLKTFVTFCAAALLYTVIVTLGLVLFVIPGLYLAVRYAFVSFLTADRRADVLGAFGESATLSRGVRWKLFFLMVVLFALNLIGAMFFGLGLFITVPVSVFALTMVYRRLVVCVEEERAFVTPLAPVPV
jgi:uncharacterized membrane protein